MARLIFGADRADSGEILIHGKAVTIASPSDAVRNGIGYLSEDRKRYGLAVGLDVETNVVLAAMRRYVGPLGVVNSRETRATAEREVQHLAIKTPSVASEGRNLSGGNQQKIVVAKWLTRDYRHPDLRRADARHRCRREVRDLPAAQRRWPREGKAIVMISSELPEILRMSHRILVMCEGRITGEVNGRRGHPGTDHDVCNATAGRGGGMRMTRSSRHRDVADG